MLSIANQKLSFKEHNESELFVVYLIGVTFSRSFQTQNSPSLKLNRAGLARVCENASKSDPMDWLKVQHQSFFLTCFMHECGE